ncbi:MAG TPA: alanine racemase, partial [Solirubrobacterales bacterium]|nr:alanine racemase [Solirubrobacterales bacterium]
RAVARVDLGAVERNCRLLSERVGRDTELCAVVKANGYGHGAAPCAAAAIRGGAGVLAVAAASEAEELRLHFADARILVMGALTEAELRAALAARAEVAVWREGFRQLCSRIAAELREPARVHLKLDSGMGRLGERDSARLIELAQASESDSNLTVSGVWTHFATADEEGDEFLAAQLAAFAPVADAVREISPRCAVHAANSAATLRERATHFDIVRCGIAIYGLDPFHRDPAEHGLEPALELHSYVADVKRFERGASAGYGRSWRAPMDTWVGVLPVGYGDGVRRGLTNNAEVLVGGRRYPLVGTVSMDNITIDLGPETGVEAGAPAVLIGAQGGERITAEELAERLDTINYEITCGISSRVPREMSG